MTNYSNDCGVLAHNCEILAHAKFRQEFAGCWKRSGCKTSLLPVVSNLYYRSRAQVENYVKRFQTVPSDEMVRFIIERELNGES